jgi:hypothetical protein
MSAREIASIFVWALVAAGIIALFLSAIPVFQPERKRFLNRFRYAFSNYGIPLWCVIELVFWLITRRWIP